MSRKTALISCTELGGYCYGEQHPFKVQRYRLAHDLMDAYGLLDLPTMELRHPRGVTHQELLGCHSPEYLETLRDFSSAKEPRADFRFGLGDLENPVFPGVYDWACLGVSGTLEAARLVAEEGFAAAFNPLGGWHHAQKSRASGFSYLNDAAVAINYLLGQGKRVVYLDIDAHHGDGVQNAFYDTDRVLTISLHESGVYFFPGTGFESETGTGAGAGYSVNLPLQAHTDDALFMKAFDEVAFPLIAAFDPDVLFTQLGADTFRTDPLTRLEVTTHGYSYVLRKLRALRIPWVAVGGGGYDMMNVARAWTIAWAVMNDRELPPRLPAPFVKLISELGFPHRMLLDAMHWAQQDDRNAALDAVEKSIAQVRSTIFPVLIGVQGKSAASGMREDKWRADLYSLWDINRLEAPEKERIYGSLLPPRLRELLERGGGSLRFIAPEGLRLLRIEARMSAGERDLVFFLELCDTPHGQMELSFCIIADPSAPRFDVDLDLEGRDNCFATLARNLPEEERAMAAGLFPNQTRRGMRMFGEFLPLLERFTERLGMQLIFGEPLTYDNAIRYEQYGFDYLVGKRLMLEIDAGFAPGGPLYRRLDGSTVFRRRGMEKSVLGRSWAIHDGIMDEPWDGVRIYKTVGVHAGVDTFPTREL